MTRVETSREEEGIDKSRRGKRRKWKMSMIEIDFIHAHNVIMELLCIIEI